MRDASPANEAAHTLACVAHHLQDFESKEQKKTNRLRGYHDYKHPSNTAVADPTRLAFQSTLVKDSLTHRTHTLTWKTNTRARPYEVSHHARVVLKCKRKAQPPVPVPQYKQCHNTRYVKQPSCQWGLTSSPGSTPLNRCSHVINLL